MPLQHLQILLVEDDEVDIEFFLRKFRQTDGKQSITVTRNGIEALMRLRGQDGKAALSHPYLIITDINMPMMNGIEFIQELRRDPKLRSSVVFVLTNSVLASDKLAAYDQQVAGYVLKENISSERSALIHLVECYQNGVEFPPYGITEV